MPLNTTDLGYEVLGIDNLNSYYNVDLKSSGLNELLELTNFSFNQIDMIQLDKLGEIFNSFKPNLVVHLAAQAGVRHSLVDPNSYLESNIISFYNLLECLKNSSVEKFVFASSSSVYGNSMDVPYAESDKTNSPVSLLCCHKEKQ